MCIDLEMGKILPMMLWMTFLLIIPMNLGESDNESVEEAEVGTKTAEVETKTAEVETAR